MVPGTSKPSMTQSRRRRCWIGRPSGLLAVTGAGLRRARSPVMGGHTPCSNCVVARPPVQCTLVPGREGFRHPISRPFGARSAAPVGRCKMLAKPDMPRWIASILSWPGLLPISRAALVSAFLIGGIQKLVDFPGAVAEQAHFGLQPAWRWAGAAVAVELGGSALVIFGRLVWLGAGALGVLTAVAMLAANNFWVMDG